MNYYEYLSAVIGGPDPAARAVSDWTIETLTGVIEGRLPVRAVTHPLGFTCLPVERAGPRGVCVHLWSPRVPRAAPTTSAIHAHCWRLTSIALFGQLENRLLTLADAATGSTAGSVGDPDADAEGPAATWQGRPGAYRLLEVRSHGDLDELRPTPRLVRCLPGPLQVIAAGDVVRRERCDAARTAAAARVVLDRLSTPTARWRRTR